ncbi:MAG: hypothetical protein U1F11_03790 [Steroidobacteraceae bacterium]
MNSAAPAVTGNRLAQLLYRPPWVGLLAFLIVFVVQALGHTVMIVMEQIFGPGHVYEIAFGVGAAGAVLLFIGMRSRNEVAATWLGFWAGTLLWTGWVEFSFVWSAHFLGVPDLMDPHAPGEIATKAEYLVMMSSVGVLGATLLHFLLNKETKCNMFLWVQRKARLKTGRPSPAHERNFAAITALETVYVVWFCYLLLLFIYDEDILGDRHPVTYVLFFLNVIWAVYLFQRLMRFWKVTTAIRYGIPTAIIAWNAVEIAGRWNLFTSFWEKPWDYGLEMGLIAGGIAVAALLAARTPAHKKAELSRARHAAQAGGPSAR